MKSQWIIQCVGTSEEDQAHLRLLLRSARKQISAEWAWGAESEADLLMMDRRSPIGDAAIQRVAGNKAVSAQLIDADEPEPTGRFLRKPFHKDAFAALLNEVASTAAVASTPSSDTAPSASATTAKPDEIEPVSTPAAPVTAATPAIAQDSQDPAPAESNPPPASGKTAEPAVDDSVKRWLLHYLPKRVLGGPAKIALPDSPLLLVDPEARMFWAKGPLPLLEPYANEPLRMGDWIRLTPAELEEACRGIDARPYAQLIWMDSFIHSRGVLSRRFDPEGLYRLTKRLDLSNDYPRALRISAQMTNPRRLDAIARASGAELSEVFDVVNAYEAIGFLEWTRPGAAAQPKA